MILAVAILCLLSIKDELSGLIDLYSTLQGNLKAYAINVFITGMFVNIEFYFDYWILEQISANFWLYFWISIIVNTVAAVSGVIIISQKHRLKRLLRRKRISKSQKKRWEKIKEYEDRQVDIEEREETLTEGEMR